MLLLDTQSHDENAGRVAASVPDEDGRGGARAKRGLEGTEKLVVSLECGRLRPNALYMETGQGI